MDHADPRVAHAHARFLEGDCVVAQAIYEQLLAEGLSSSRMYADLGVIYGQLHRVDDQIFYLRKAMALAPSSPVILANLGIGLRRSGLARQAVVAFRLALELHPSFPEAWGGLGHALRDLGEHDQALHAYTQSLAIAPQQISILNALGLLQRERGELAASRAAFAAALCFDPASAETHWGLALTALMEGAYAEAWPHYTYRWRRPSAPQPHALPNVAAWTPSARDVWPTELVLVSEQGLGDTLQFARYSLHLRRLGLHITLCVQPPLVELLACAGLADLVVPVNAIPPGTSTTWLPLLDLPAVLGVTPEQPLISSPYLQPPPQWCDVWGARLQDEHRPLVALHWQGNTLTEQQFARGRSFALESLAPLFCSSPLSLISLQKGPGSDQLGSCSFRDQFVACQEQLNPVWDFVQIAAVLMHCDLVITSDSALAHLAGALGRPTWLLLPFCPDWRWGLQSSTTFWYPTVRLFRQPRRGDWPAVVQVLQTALDEWLMQRSI